MKKSKFCLLFLALFLTACSPNTSNTTDKVQDTDKSNQVSKIEDTTKAADDSTKNDSNTSQKNQANTNNNQKKPDTANTKDNTSTENNITEKTKQYILNGQENKSEAQKIKWSKTFLDKVDIENLYKQYKATGGKANDLESFAKYITKNAPIRDDWQELFKKDFYAKYNEKVVSLKPLENDSYQAYVMKDGAKVPYVVVSARTGYFHG